MRMLWEKGKSLNVAGEKSRSETGAINRALNMKCQPKRNAS